MKRFVPPILVILLLLAPGFAGAETGEELIQNPEKFDGKRVNLQGEVVGVMIRGDQAWVNVYSDGYAIGVWAKAQDAEKISFIGDYMHLGDTVAVTGEFHKSCPKHGGDLDIHAYTLTILSTGAKLERWPSLQLVVFSSFLFVFAAIIGVWLRHVRRERERLHYLMEEQE